MKKSLSGSMKSIKGINNKTNKTMVFDSIVDASKALNIPKSNISSVLTGKRKSAGGWTWQEIEEEERIIVETKNSEEKLEYLCDSKGVVKSWAGNIDVWLKSSFKSFRYNDFNYACEVDGKQADDAFFSCANHQLDLDLHFSNIQKLRDAVLYQCKQDSYNPLKEYFDELIWDGTPRVARFFIDFLGAEDTPLNEKMTRYWFKQVPARVNNPGCMFDSAIILCDKTGGTGKTKVFDRIGRGRTCKMNANEIRKAEKDAVGKLNESIIVNFDELKGWTAEDFNNLKSFITATSHLQRLPYDRSQKNYPVHCVFCGTTNEEHFLKDMTTILERRFWILDCHGKVRSKSEWQSILTDDFIDQLWAEASYLYQTQGVDNDDFTSEELQEMEQQHLRHKSYNNDSRSLNIIESILEHNFSQDALIDYITFENETKSKYSEGTAKFDKIRIRWLSGVIGKGESYTKFICRELSGWTIDGEWLVRDTNDDDTNFFMELD